jgi:DNA-binding transcriptional MerR regulator
MSDLLTADLAAIRAGVSYSTIQRYVTLGILPVARRGPRRQIYFEPVKIDEWRIWYRQNLETIKEKKRRRASALSKVNGMMIPGQLPCEEQDESDRNRLFSLAYGIDKEPAKKALIELYEKYTLRLPLEEERVGLVLNREI